MAVFFETIGAALLAIIVENVIFTTAFGTSTLISLSKRDGQIFFCGLFITEFSVLSSMIAYVFEGLMLKSDISARFLPTLYIISLGLVYIATLLVIWFVSKKAFNKVKRYIHLSAFNCTVLSVLFNDTLIGGGLGERVLFGLEVGIGFALAAYILSVNYEKLNSDEVPASFSGFPIHVLYIGIVSMVVYALGR
ncbi:MAG: hypothetical protein LUH56_06040 [Oscillospiraceae bacterium]|nr:hypothetical protein [Ruminococcus sp.]MCD7732984.1 hypothetical protein [Oscillospiraceae bacterium]MCD7804759.1 hypothetical protein [Oscillospiraceae bacterium]MCD7890093.1 hypothetical protein [Oscillospiraceae bacterium]